MQSPLFHWHHAQKTAPVHAMNQQLLQTGTRQLLRLKQLKQLKLIKNPRKKMFVANALVQLKLLLPKWELQLRLLQKPTIANYLNKLSDIHLNA